LNHFRDYFRFVFLAFFFFAFFAIDISWRQGPGERSVRDSSPWFLKFPGDAF